MTTVQTPASLPVNPSANPSTNSSTNPSTPTVIVIGAGIGGLTTAALLARRGFAVKLFEQAAIPGGCASTFQRRGFTFDVGATQVAGLEPGGIHHRIFQDLDLELPPAHICDPACAVYLPGESQPISVWRDRNRWKTERVQQFPGSQGFWWLLDQLFEISWRFQSRDPVLPPRDVWDLSRLLQALRPDTLLTAPFALATVGDALRWFGLGQDWRLRTFLDLQLKLYSQVNAEETALLYAATALNVSQSPQGLYHLQGSMQVLSDRLVSALVRDGGQIYLRHSVEHIQVENSQCQGVRVKDLKTGETRFEPADQVVANVTVQNWVDLLGDQAPVGYRQRVQMLPTLSGAFVLYLGVDQSVIPADCPLHFQFLYDADGPIGENNSLFVSVSRAGDGRAPEGCATIIASSFTDPLQWWQTPNYEALKQNYVQVAIAKLQSFFPKLESHRILHQEAATPRTFARYTARDQGVVGGIGQRLNTFGPFGFATRTPIAGAWLVGDSTHPGEGTAGVSYSAWTVVEQIVEQIRSKI